MSFLSLLLRFLRRAAALAISALALSAAQPVLAAEARVTVAAAADLKFVLPELIALFARKAPDFRPEVVYGSSGKFHAQLSNGAPFDLYFSADIAYPQDLLARAVVPGPVLTYAIGRLVLWSAQPSLAARPLELSDLTRPGITHVAIANPRHAPYGKRAEEALRAAGVWDKVEAKLVFGENVAQAAQFVDGGAAQAGIVALSLVMSPVLAGKGSYRVIAADQHQPLVQGLVLTARGAANPLTRRFADFVMGPEARLVWRRYGFLLPGEKAND